MPQVSTVSAASAPPRAAAPEPPASAVTGGLHDVRNVAQAWRPPAPSVHVLPIAATRYDLSALTEWVNRGAPGEARARAAEAIRRLVLSGGTELELNHLGLTELPPLPADIKRLGVSGNRLTAIGALPDALRSLGCGQNHALSRLEMLPERLEELFCCDTGLTGLPRLPASLKGLYLGGTPLRSLPALPQQLEHLRLQHAELRCLPELPDALRILSTPNCGIEMAPSRWPTQLRILGLRGNLLTSIPALPGGLQQCDLADNLLTSLPINIDVLRPGRPAPLDLTRNPLETMAVDELMHLNRERGPVVRYSPRTDRPDGGMPAHDVRPTGASASAWFPPLQAEKRGEWSRLAQEPGAEAFFAFLRKLYGSPWRGNPAFAGMMRAWLDRLALPESAELREAVFAISLDASESCNDRALHALYCMRMKTLEFDAQAGLYDGTPAALLEQAMGFQAFEALTRLAQGIVQARAQGRYEEIEVYLRLFQRFGHLLPAVVPDAPMGFEGLAHLDEADFTAVEHALKVLERGFPRYLCNWAPMESVLKRWAPARHAAADALVRDTVESDAFAVYQRAHGFKGMGALEALRHEVFAPLVREYLVAHGIDASWM